MAIGILQRATSWRTCSIKLSPVDGFKSMTTATGKAASVPCANSKTRVALNLKSPKSMKPASGFLGKLRSMVSGARPDPYFANLGCGGGFFFRWGNFGFVFRSPHVISHDLRTRLPLNDGRLAGGFFYPCLVHF